MGVVSGFWQWAGAHGSALSDKTVCRPASGGVEPGRAPEQRRGHPAPSTGLARLTSRWRTAELRGCWTRPCGASDVMVWRCYREEPHPVAGHRPPPTTCPTREGSREVEADVVSSTKEPLAANNTIHPFSRFMARCSGKASCTAMYAEVLPSWGCRWWKKIIYELTGDARALGG